jgi:DNA invertase Pin-like site-specific DNA recombinase
MRRTRVAVYARFSCDKQRDASIDDQLYEANRYCERHDGYAIVATYADYAMSGRSDDRPQFLRMMEDAKAGRFDVILVWKMDRFARNMEDHFFHEHELTEAGVRLESVRENISGDSIEATSNKALVALFAQIRSQSSAEDAIRGMTGKARKCQYLGYRVFGYGHEGDEITVDEAQAEVVRRIHREFLAGHSVNQIARELVDEGFRKPNGKPASYGFVWSVLKTRKNAGLYTWGQRKDEDGRVVTDADGNPVPLISVAGGMPAIVSMEEKEECLRRIGYNRRGAADHVNYILSGRIWCASCGNPMHCEASHSKGRTYRRYVCKGKRHACFAQSSQPLIDATVVSAVRSVMGDEGLCKRLCDLRMEYQELGEEQREGRTVRPEVPEGEARLARPGGRGRHAVVGCQGAHGRPRGGHLRGRGQARGAHGVEGRPHAGGHDALPLGDPRRVPHRRGGRELVRLEGLAEGGFRARRPQRDGGRIVPRRAGGQLRRCA